MDKTIGQFVSALRKADLEVSPAETLDAMAALELIGCENKVLLRDSLSIILAKTQAEKAAFSLCFDRFFSFNQFLGSASILEKIRSHDRPAESQSVSLSDEQSGHEKSGDDARIKGKRRGENRFAHHQSRLGHILLSGDPEELAVALSRAAKAVHLEQMKSLRERSLYTRRILLHLGVDALEDEIHRLQVSDDQRQRATAGLLTEARSYLTDEVRAYVEEQYLLLVDASGNQFIAEAVANTKLTNMQVYYFDHIRQAVRKLAHKLAKRHAKRKRIVHRGQLDIRRTIRKNLAYDGALFELEWKQIKQERPKVFVLCDVSGSVKNVARFLLTFLYSLNEVLPDVRAFAFSSELGEVTEYFDHYSLDEAIDMSLDDFGKGSTDYGKALAGFKELCRSSLDSRSTVIILGDARNNYFANGAKDLQDISTKCRQVIWLNPESRDRWDEGDAEMKSYLPSCHIAAVCNSLPDLERIVSQVLRTAEK